ncbi:hypothetical protein ABW19_dt0201477 [Dactylella cylindrospora]|nr:hypothetical protein ABW19_dt0201477 [Dactylella cylindrospora]
MSSSEDSAVSIGIPQIIFCAFIALIVYRYVINSPGGSGSSRGGSGRPRVHVPPEMVAGIQAMFPQITATAIRYELERNGGNMQAVTERILTTGSLPEPPTPPQPTIPQQSSRTPLSSTPQRPLSTTPHQEAPTRAGGSSSSVSTTLTGHTDLITRYNLQSRLENYQLGQPLPEETVKKNDKASLFLRGRERRDNMILAARRRMEEKLSKS